MSRAPSPHNLTRFIMAQMIANDAMRNRIYDYLRARHNWQREDKTPKEMREHAVAEGDEYAIKLCKYAEQLHAARVALLKADLVLR